MEMSYLEPSTKLFFYLAPRVLSVSALIIILTERTFSH